MGRRPGGGRRLALLGTSWCRPLGAFPRTVGLGQGVGQGGKGVFREGHRAAEKTA